MDYHLVPTKNVTLVKALDTVTMPNVGFGEWPTKRDVHWLLKDEEGEPVGYCSVRPTGYNPKEHVFLSRAGVLPAHRGQGLQRRMIRVRVAWARKQGFTTVVTYVHYTNIASLRNLTKEGFLPFIPGGGKQPSPEDWAGRESIYLMKSLDI